MAFDLSSLVSQPVTEANATSIKPCPIGEYTARIADLRSGEKVEDWFREVNTKRGPSLTIRIPCVILDENVRKELGRENIIVNFDSWIDIGPSGSLATGEGVNVGIGRLRAAVGLNDPSVPFLFSQLPGAGPFKAKVDHRSDANDSSIKYAEIVRVSSL